MNIGIIIGVCNYIDIKNNLPGCKNDAEAINGIIQKTNKFENILYINNDESSAQTKELITNFITEHKDKQINELLFYYSGHGQFLNNEFYYILSDFDTKKRNQTSLQNTEIDDLFRTLSPKLVIKIIDACQSGTAYIKENNVLNKYFDATKKGFEKCYFLNSSLNNQSSYQNHEISFFTNSFISALSQHKSESIRYKDIIDVILDEFQDNNEQTPFFVIQADLTEKFCSFSGELRNYLDVIRSGIGSANYTADKPSTIFEIIRDKAKEYVDKDGALETIQFIKHNFDKSKLDSRLDEFYIISISYLEKLNAIPKKQSIANWLKNNSDGYFATPIYEEVYDEDFGGPITELNDFELGIEAPFKGISIDITGNLPNLIDYHSTVTYIVSKRSIRFFYFVTNYVEKSWDSKYINQRDIQWVTMECQISDKIQVASKIKSVFKDIEDKILTELNQRYNFDDSDDITDKSEMSEPSESNNNFTQSSG